MIRANIVSTGKGSANHDQHWQARRVVLFTTYFAGSLPKPAATLVASYRMGSSFVYIGLVVRYLNGACKCGSNLSVLHCEQASNGATSRRGDLILDDGRMLLGF